MLKCPNCESKLEELTEITGYHYWLCGNSDCEMSYKFYRKSAQHRVRLTAAGVCPHGVNLGNQVCSACEPEKFGGQ